MANMEQTALWLTGKIEGNRQFLTDDAREIFHIPCEVHAFAVTEVEMAFVMDVEHRMALNAKLKIQ